MYDSIKLLKNFDDPRPILIIVLLIRHDIDNLSFSFPRNGFDLYTPYLSKKYFSNEMHFNMDVN